MLARNTGMHGPNSGSMRVGRGPRGRQPFAVSRVQLRCAITGQRAMAPYHTLLHETPAREIGSARDLIALSVERAPNKTTPGWRAAAGNKPLIEQSRIAPARIILFSSAFGW